MKEKLELKEVIFEDTKLLLNKPIEIEQKTGNGGHYLFENKEFNILVWDDDIEKALENFQEHFVTLYDRLMMTNDDCLINKAKAMKKKLQNIVIQKIKLGES